MMSRVLATVLGIVSFFALATAPASAATVTLTFDGVTNTCGACGPGFPSSIMESGYTIGGSPSNQTGGGSVHLDGGGTSFSNFVSISAPTRFAVNSLDVTGYASHFLSSTDTPLAYDNVLFEGFRNGIMVASSVFSTGITGGLFNVALGGLFSNLDMFSVTQTGPSAAEFAFNRGSYCANVPCSHVDIDNVTFATPAAIAIAAVPLPAMAPALAGSLALLGLFGWKRRSA